MKRFRLPKVNLKGSSVAGFFNYILVILLTSVIFVDILIALPLTERVTNLVSYDLETKNELYWAKEYTLELYTTDLINKEEAINGVKNILDKRLVSLGVEKRTITSESLDEKDIVKVSVQSTKPQIFVDELVRSPFILNIVTRKGDVNFDDPEDPYAAYLGQNYESTEFTRSTFRNIYITQLKNSANEYSYFALFKTWPWESKWNTFLKDHQGELIGVSIDGFVTPMQIPLDDISNFALPISTTERDEMKLISILYNSGVMPTSYTLVEQTAVQVEQIESDYVKITEGILIAVVLIYLYLLLIDRTPKKVLVTAGLSTLITLASWITYLKIAAIPVDISILAIEVIAVIAILRITTENRESHLIVNILTALITSVAIVLGTGYVKLFAFDMLILIILGNVSQLISAFYINKIKGVLRV